MSKRSGNMRENPDSEQVGSKKKRLQTSDRQRMERDRSTKSALGKGAEGTTEKEQTFVVFDLETTGLKMPHITQISAVSLHSNETFNSYVLPKKPIEQRAQEMTGLRLDRSGKNLELHGHRVQSVTITETLKRFLKWLKKFQNAVLVAHYGKKFDFPALLLAIRNVDTENRLDKSVHGYVDSWEVFRQRHTRLSSYKQEDLVMRFLHETYKAHNGENDVAYLKKLINNKIPNPDCLVDFRFTLSDIDVKSVMLQ